MKKNIFFIISSFSIFLLVFTILRASIKQTPINVGNKLSNFASFFPQGWSFFTKPIPEYQFDIYDSQKNKINTFNTSSENFYGLKKFNRYLPYLVEGKLGDIDEKYWVQFDGSIDSLKIDELNFYKIKEEELPDAIKGTYLIKLYEVIPWVYFSKDVSIKKKYYYINIVLL